MSHTHDRGLLPTLLGCILGSLLTAHAHATSVDVLFVYEKAAVAWLGSSSEMTTFSEDAVNRMNLAMQNSGVEIRFRHVHSMAVDYNHSGLMTDLIALQEGADVFASVHRARDLYHADLVALLADTGSTRGFIGISYLLTYWSGMPDYAFSASAIRSVAIGHTLTHEIGHNLGAHHARYQTSDPGPNDFLGSPYSAGWYFTGSDGVDYHSIMAYNFDGRGGTYQPAPLFSTPLKTYQDSRTGDADTADNARLLEETGCIIAGYRSSGLMDTPVATAATDITSSSFTANWQSVCDASGYRLDISTHRDFADQAANGFSVDAGNDSRRTITGLEPDTLYYYRVRAYNALGTSRASDVIGVTTEAAKHLESRDIPWRIAEIYIGIMDYAPDDEGLQYWIDQTQRQRIETGVNWNAADVAQSFFDQPLVQTLYPRDEDAGSLVDRLYLHLFGHPGDAEGRVYWIHELESGNLEQQTIIIAMIEAGWASPQAADEMPYLANRVEVALAFAAYQASHGLLYSALQAADQAILRQAGQEVLSGVSSDSSSRDRAIDSIPDLLRPLIWDGG